MDFFSISKIKWQHLKKQITFYDFITFFNLSNGQKLPKFKSKSFT